MKCWVYTAGTGAEKLIMPCKCGEFNTIDTPQPGQLVFINCPCDRKYVLEVPERLS